MKKQLMLAAAISALSLNAFANYTQLTLGLGANASSLSKTSVISSNAELNLSVTQKGGYQTKFTPSLSDTFHLTFAKAWDWQIGLQYIFTPYASWNVKSEDTATSTYDNDIYKVSSNILLANTGFGFHPSDRIEISTFVGMGTSFNSAKGRLRSGTSYQPPYQQDGAYKKHTDWQFAWDIGAAMDYNLTKSWALGMSYQFIQGGQANTGPIVINNNNIHIKTKINRQVYLATLSYIFNRTGDSV